MMKEFCFGLALGTVLGVLAVNSSDKLQKVAKAAAKEAEKKVNEIKKQIQENSSEEE